MFVDPASSGTLGATPLLLLPPWSTQGQAALNHTSTLGEALQRDAAASTAEACADACVAQAACGGWTFRQPPAREGSRGQPATCMLMKAGARVLANVGSGCDALGSGSGTDVCTSGIVGWQLVLPGVPGRMAVELPAGAAPAITLEIFVDQQICEVFLHDGRGHGSAVATFGCSPHGAPVHPAQRPSQSLTRRVMWNRTVLHPRAALVVSNRLCPEACRVR